MSVRFKPMRHYPLGMRLLFAALEWLSIPVLVLARWPRRNTSPEKILIIEPFNLGDVVGLSIMFDPLLKRFPHAEIHLLCKHYGRELYAHDSRVSRIHEFEFPWSGQVQGGFSWRGFFRLLRELRGEHFDIGIDTRGEIRTQLLAVLAGCRRRIGHTNYLCSDVHLKGFLLTDNAGRFAPMPRSQMNAEVLRLLGCDVADARMRLEVRRQASHPRKVLIHTGAGWEYKLWQEEKWAELINRILACHQYDVVLVGSAQERKRLDSINGKLRFPIMVKTTTLDELIAEIAGSGLMVSLDSGAMHLASALNVPVLALFGCGSVDIWRPLSVSSRVVHKQSDYPCAPCLSLRCVRPEHNCMAAISVDDVWRELREMLSSIMSEKKQQEVIGGRTRPDVCGGVHTGK